jgi:hypothetical protein
MKPRRLFLLFSFAVVVAAVASVVACGGGFAVQSKVDSVRLFATKADKPYTKPGETVTLEALYTDARKDKPRPLKNYWIPVVCMNPRDDLYYLCFAPPSVDGGATFIAGGVDGGIPDGGGAPNAGADAGGGGILSQIPRGVDLGPFLPQGNTFTFTMPSDAIRPRQGSGPYGIAIIFNLLCAGKVILVDVDPNGGPQQVPLQCVDEENQKLPPSDYVIGISRVYSYAEKTNTNPVIEKLTLDGKDVDVAKGIDVETCKGVDKRDDCPEHKVDVKVTDGSWEPNPSETARGTASREQVWVAYYNDHGDFRDDARLLFDATRGRLVNSETIWRAPYDPVDGTIWAVVHDNRGGAAWLVVPVRVRVDPPPDAGPPDAGTD